jgi:hypothetical protein
MKDFSEETRVLNYAIPGAFVDLVQKGIVKAADFQKFALDFYARQAADAIRAFKSMLPATSWPGILFVDAADFSLNTIVEMQKGLVDLFSQNSLAGVGIQSETAKTDEDLGGKEKAIASQGADRVTELINSTKHSEKKIFLAAMQQNDAMQNQTKSVKSDKRQFPAKKVMRKGRS